MRKPNYKYILLNKPYGVLPQFTDKLGRPTLKDLVPFKNVYPVGRLDLDSEGLLLLTDDGALNHHLSSPRNKQPKTYWAQVEGIPDEAALDALRKGVMIEGQITLPAKVKSIDEPPNLWPRLKPIRFRENIPTSWIEITITEGRNRQVRKMTAAVGFPCLRLIRISIGSLKLENLLPGKYREIARVKRGTGN
ncbi:MAG: rRNA large subunit pseudouridine synthase E [Candidatus Margulisiibacteriota bacterium]